ncbi:hypothetical protein DPQ33_01060 [Oceanidesulfovibrio indonesiensis]|uniref:Glycerophosphoryl diester phosphodiesterase membrane domain-containing protein n=1 Tax=Oceanidesulfovibrio indonesiensis TaxID=54767 RepID=A0A7M3MKC3_9BACT|nr:hypothetical protein [Oceanidesulfovibrio indonesiensis]TVM19852.1 hypothetical protein DPQ33_01060 [Oceanidesulfovibrio indonesiensis]
MQYRIGEMGMGQLLDVAFSVVRDHYKPLIIVAVLAFLPVAVITLAVVLGGMWPLFDQLMAFDATGQIPDPDATLRTMTPLFVGAGVLGVLWYLTTIVSEAAISFVGASHYLDNPVSPREALRYCFSRWWSLLKTALLIALIVLGVMIGGGVAVTLAIVGLGMVGGGLLAGLTGFVLVTALLVGIMLLFLRYLLALKIVVLEGMDGREALARSAFLMKGTYGRAFILLFLLGVAGNIIGSAAQFIPFLPVAMVVSIAVQVTIYVYSTTVWTMYYFSNRCRHENFDLLLLAEEAAR